MTNTNEDALLLNGARSHIIPIGLVRATKTKIDLLEKLAADLPVELRSAPMTSYYIGQFAQRAAIEAAIEHNTVTYDDLVAMREFLEYPVQPHKHLRVLPAPVSQQLPHTLLAQKYDESSRALVEQAAKYLLQCNRVGMAYQPLREVANTANLFAGLASELGQSPGGFAKDIERAYRN